MGIPLCVPRKQKHDVAKIQKKDAEREATLQVKNADIVRKGYVTPPPLQSLPRSTSPRSTSPRSTSPRSTSPRSTSQKSSLSIIPSSPPPSSEPPPPPLMNKGEICYLNSIVQALGSCKKMREDLKELDKLYTSTKLKQFINLLDALNSKSAQQEFDCFVTSYGWKKEGQQDTYEMFAFFINQIYDELREESNHKSKKDKNEFNKYWKGKILPGRINLNSRTKCECISDNKNISNDLSLHLPLINREGKDNIKYDVDVMIKDVLKEDEVDDKCDKCNKVQKLIISLEGDPPRTLCLHIQANKYDFITDRMVKPPYELKYPFQLTVGDRKYELVSLIVHMGDVSVGHYVAYRKQGSSWFIANDTQVDPLPTVMNPMDYSLKPYVLFYEIT